MAQETSKKKVIAVMGATGLQGGAVVEALLKFSDQFDIRAITRTPDSEKAKALAAKGIEVVKADADDEDTMTRAFSDAYGAFLVTNFWSDMNMQHEIDQTKILQKAVIAADVKHVVLSTLEDTRPIIQEAADVDTWPVIDEKLQSYVPHYDGKGQASKEFFASSAPTTLLYTSFYYDNFINFGMGPTKHSEDQPLAITFPTGYKPLSMNSLQDIGESVSAIFQDPSLINTRQGVASSLHSGEEIADAFSKILGVPVVFNAVDTTTYASFGFPGAAELANMFRFQATYGFIYREVEGSEKLLGRKTMSLVDYIEKNKEAFLPSEPVTKDSKEPKKENGVKNLLRLAVACFKRFVGK